MAKKKVSSRGRKPIKRKARRAAKKKVITCPKKNDKAFEQFLAERNLMRQSHMTSADIRREARALWAAMDEEEKKAYVLLAQKAPYVFHPKDMYLRIFMCSLRMALADKKKLNMVELLCAARNFCHWKQSALEGLTLP